jgi:hypothetical protein
MEAGLRGSGSGIRFKVYMGRAQGRELGFIGRRGEASGHGDLHYGHQAEGNSRSGAFLMATALGISGMKKRQ